MMQRAHQLGFKQRDIEEAMLRIPLACWKKITKTILSY
jgi:hypothetical protein